MRACILLCLAAASLFAEEPSPRPVKKSVDGITYVVTIRRSFRDATKRKRWISYCTIMVEGIIKRAKKKQAWQVKYTLRSDFIEYLTVTAEGDRSVLEITHYIPKKCWQIEKAPYSIGVSANELSVAINQGGESYAVYDTRVLAQARKEAEKAKKLLAICRELFGITREDLGIASIRETFKSMDGLIEK